MSKQQGYPVVKLGRVRLDVVIDEALERSGHVGEASIGDREIRLSPNQTPQQMAETLVHEVLHIISDRQKANLTEKQVLRMEVGLADFIAQNLPLIQRLHKELQ